MTAKKTTKPAAIDIATKPSKEKAKIEPVADAEADAAVAKRVDSMLEKIEDRVAERADHPEVIAPEPDRFRGLISCVDLPVPGRTKDVVDDADAMVPGSMRDLAWRFIESLADDATESTRRSYAMDLERACDYLGQRKMIAKLTRKEVDDYFASDTCTKLRNGNQKAKPTVDKQRRVLRLALAWAAKTGFEIASSPIEKA